MEEKNEDTFKYQIGQRVYIRHGIDRNNYEDVLIVDKFKRRWFFKTYNYYLVKIYYSTIIKVKENKILKTKQ